MSGYAALILKLSWNGFTKNVRIEVVFGGFGLEWVEVNKFVLDYHLRGMLTSVSKVRGVLVKKCLEPRVLIGFNRTQLRGIYGGDGVNHN